MTAISNANLPVSNGSGDAALAHVQSTRVIGSTTIATDTIANWPSFFIATTGTLLANGFIDPTSKTDFYGHLGVGNQLVIDGFCPGNTDNGNTSTQVVVIKPNTEWANLIAQGVQGTSLFPSQLANFVEPAGGVWSISSGLVGVQTVGNVWYQGVRYSIPAVATLTFTASKDTYVDVNPATGVYTYVTVTNGAAEPAVTASCVRVARIITNANAIVAISQNSYQTPVTSNTLANNASFWQELGRMTFTAAVATNTFSFNPKTYLRILVNMLPSGAITGLMRFNGDTGANYAYAQATNAGGLGTGVSLTSLTLDVDGNAVNKFLALDLVNIAAQEKLCTAIINSDNTAGAATFPNMRLFVGKWANTSAQINSITLFNGAGGSFAAGTEVIVLGHN